MRCILKRRLSTLVKLTFAGSVVWMSMYLSWRGIFSDSKYEPNTTFLLNEKTANLTIIRSSDLTGNDRIDLHPFVRELSQLNLFPESFMEDNRAAINDLPRAKPKWTGDFPCSKGGNTRGAKYDLIFVKIHKCASTTNSNVAVRIARNHGKCHLHYKHQAAFNISGLDVRDRKTSFLWTFVRNPTERYVSHFYYFDVSRHDKPPTDENLKKFLNKKFMGMGGYQLPYATVSRLDSELNPNVTKLWSPQNPTHIQNSRVLVDRVRNIIEEYNFIGISERVNESLVVLSFLLDLSFRDIAYISKRVSGGYDKFYDDDRSAFCVKTLKSHISQSKEDYFRSAEWKARIAGDNLLYQSAVKSLDLTIDKIGRKVFSQRLDTFEKLLDEVQAACSREECEYCTSSGELQERNGNCGHRCILNYTNRLAMYTH